MRNCEVGIIGLGLMGSAALHALTRRGCDVLGFDPIAIGEARGSSHGSCRIFRRFNFESQAYTALSDQAFAGWRALEAESGRTILKPCPVLEAGPPGSAFVASSRAAASAMGITSQVRTGREANAAFPAFSLPDDWDVVVQESSGILLAEEAMLAFRASAKDRIVSTAARIQPMPQGIRIVTSSEEVMAERVIVAAGPWIGDFIPQLKKHLSVTRQVVGWFAPAKPKAARYGACPVFIIKSPRGMIYGFPDFEGRGVKAAQHDLGPIVAADAWGPPPSNAELEVVAANLRELIPGASGPIVERDVCLYTNTAKADVFADDGQEFIIDRLPREERIIVASPCSGHGAKFASAIGVTLADMALDPKRKSFDRFRLDRFSGFAREAQ